MEDVKEDGTIDTIELDDETPKKHAKKHKHKSEDEIEEEKEEKEEKEEEEEEEEEDRPCHSEVIVVAEEGTDVVAARTSNSYAAKKTVAQGMMDIALITSNANQLRYLMEYASDTKTYYLNLFLISFSLILQVAVGVSLLFKGRYQMKGDPKHKNVSKINNFSVIGVFLVTLINVFIASFSMSEKKEVPKPAVEAAVI